MQAACRASPIALPWADGSPEGKKKKTLRLTDGLLQPIKNAHSRVTSDRSNREAGSRGGGAIRPLFPQSAQRRTMVGDGPIRGHEGRQPWANGRLVPKGGLLEGVGVHPIGAEGRGGSHRPFCRPGLPSHGRAPPPPRRRRRRFRARSPGFGPPRFGGRSAEPPPQGLWSLLDCG